MLPLYAMLRVVISASSLAARVNGVVLVTGAQRLPQLRPGTSKYSGCY